MKRRFRIIIRLAYLQTFLFSYIDGEKRAHESKHFKDFLEFFEIQ